MNVLFRTDASVSIGIGHVMRSFTLAEALRDAGWNCVFVSRELPGHAGAIAQTKGFNMLLLPDFSADYRGGNATFQNESWLGCDWRADAAETESAIGLLKVSPGWIVVDHYGIDRKWEERFRSAGWRLLVIDDLADREHVADIILDQNDYVGAAQRYDSLVPGSCQKLLGGRYALLRREFLQLRDVDRPRDGALRRILVSYGGADHTRQTMKAIAALAWTEAAGIAVDIVVGSANPIGEEIRRACSARSNVTFHCQVETMAHLMAQADLALAAGGTVTWELACMGVPACLTVVADNQKRIVDDLAIRGLTIAVGSADVTTAFLEQSVRALAADKAQRLTMREGLRSLVDGRGALRVVDALLGSCAA